ncbi:MAG: adenylate kinase [Erysipelotrichaceae bacterium]|jgi:adenylate kinase|nr:adenylate kinase [Erysipelotrichaceae bacterium]MBQ1757309.1 adenylate kinase [Erysipelotrichaceae bacterium]MBQ2685636.1 adenylate kinase [Erysipelotrichaceae bacterium]
MTLNMLIMGPAGAGKGTMSELIEKKYNVAHISTGDMFRSEIKNNTELGQKATEYIKQGLLVPDEVTIAMVLKRMSQPDCDGGYLLDGFPRSLVQADVFDTKVIETPKEVNIVINLTVDKEALFDRIENRRICRQCGAVYNMHTLPPKVEGVCDNCGGELYQRADDNRESLERRMQSYEEETFPVLTHYRRLNLVHDVNASQTIEEVWADVQKVIDGFIAEHQEGK